MSETISQLPPGSVGFLSDVIPLTQQSTGPGTGTSRKLSSAKVLGSNGLIYAGDPAFGVIANGSADDTNAWVAALAVAAITGAWVVAPTGVSLVTSFTLPSNVGIIGQSNVECVSVANAQGSPILGSVISSSSPSLPTILMAANSRLQDIQIDGNPGQDAVRFNGGAFASYQVDNVDIFGALNGINGNNIAGASVISRCRIHECTNGLANLVDACVVNNTITNNLTAGINLGVGAARVMITGNRISANGINLNFVGNSTTPVANVVATGNMIHDANGNNILTSFCHNVTISGNSVGCAGRTQGTTPGGAQDANYQIGSCVGVVISGNSSWVSNDITGYIGPFWAVFDAGGNTNCLISSNILPYHNNAASSTSGPINITTTFNLASALNVPFWTATN